MNNYENILFQRNEGGVKDVDWKFIVGDMVIPITTFLIGLFAGRTIERKKQADAKIDGNNNTIIQNSNVRERK